MLHATAVRLAGTAGVAFAQLRRRPFRTAFAVAGVALAVLAVTLLAGVGAGVVDVGQSQFDSADRDVWVSAEGTAITPARGGGFANVIGDSHAVADRIESHEGVAGASPIAFQTVYVDAGDGDFQTVIAGGIEGTGSVVSVDEGRSFSAPGRHHAGGTYEGEPTRELVLDRETAEELEVEVGDTVRVGGSIATARETEYTVVGTSSTFSELLGSRSAVLPLAELQTLTGTAERDTATFVTAVTTPSASPEAVAADLDDRFPDLAVRTSGEQLEAVLAQRATVLLAGATIVALAILAGLALTAGLCWLFVHHQRDTFAALLAQGCSPRTVGATVAWQGVGIGATGAVVGVALTFPAATGLSALAARLVGYEGLVAIQPWMLGAGAAIALVVGTAAATLAAGGLVRGGLAPPRN